jgi:formylglycine-generating enzyme required for sulfatase activity
MHHTFSPRLLFCALVHCAAFFSPLAASAAPITIPTVPVGNPGNANDPSTGDLFGGVADNYRIGTTEVTNDQYVEFLNAVAAIDTYSLYATNMNDSTHGGIMRIGTGTIPDPYVYTTKTDMGNKPVTYVSWGDAARFANWLHNGQPTGLQDASTTEDGAYVLNGATNDVALNAVSRNPGAVWFIPSEHEWYKAAYHKNDGTDNYWGYSTVSDTAPTAEPPPGGTNSANYFGSGVDTVTNVGAYFDSPSPYGTFDQGGNVWEWHETLIDGSFRGLRGGSWGVHSGSLPASNWIGTDPTYESEHVGFRVAAVPEPNTACLAIVGCALMLWWSKRRK